MHIHKSA